MSNVWGCGMICKYCVGLICKYPDAWQSVLLNNCDGVIETCKMVSSRNFGNLKRGLKQRQQNAQLKCFKLKAQLDYIEKLERFKKCQSQ